jgi:hypothetical protein
VFHIEFDQAALNILYISHVFGLQGRKVRRQAAKCFAKPTNTLATKLLTGA